MKVITAKFEGRCRKCGERFAAGTRVLWGKGSGARHVSCESGRSEDLERGACTPEERDELRERARDNAEYNAGIADYKRWKEDRAMFGDEIADALDIERELRFGDY